MLTTTLDAAWNDLPLQPVFVPLVHELMKYLVAHEPSPAWHTVGDVVDATALLGARDQGVAVETPSGQKRILPRERPALRLEESGWYELHAMSDPSRSGAVAVNVDPVESNLTPLDVGALITTLRAQQATPAAEETASSRRALQKDREERQSQQVWWYLLLIAAALLAAETVWSNRIRSNVEGISGTQRGKRFTRLG